jgi:hypothetical protein
LIASSLFAGPSGPAVVGGARRIAKQTISHSEVGRPKAHRNNPLVTGIAYVFRWDQWSPYFVATGSALNSQTLFAQPQNNSYTPSGGTAFVLNPWHTTITNATGTFNNPDMFNIRKMSFFFRGDIYVQDAQRFVSDTLVTLQIGDTTQYGQDHLYCFPAGGGLQGASSAVLTNGWSVSDNNYEFSTNEVNGIGTDQPGGTGYVFPNNLTPNAPSGSPGELGELVTQQQKVAVVTNPTLVIDANGNTTYTTSASGTGITAFCRLMGDYARAVQG